MRVVLGVGVLYFVWVEYLVCSCVLGKTVPSTLGHLASLVCGT